MKWGPTDDVVHFDVELLVGPEIGVHAVLVEDNLGHGLFDELEIGRPQQGPTSFPTAPSLPILSPYRTVGSLRMRRRCWRMEWK